MPVTANAPAPYAPPSAIMEVVNRYRDRGLPKPITLDVLTRAGISESLAPRTLQALQTLDLVDDQGAPTAVFEGLRVAPTAEFPVRLAEWLNAAYADALTFIDPATADEVAIRDAFRSYVPVGQQSRMVTLFQGLYAAAGIGPEKSSAPRAPRPKAPAPARPKPAANTSRQGSTAKRQQPAEDISGLPPALAGLFASLPDPGQGWTQQRRDSFVNAFGTVLDFCFPVRADAEVFDEDQGDNGDD